MERLQEIETRKAEIRSLVDTLTDVEEVRKLTQEVETLNAEVKDLQEREERKSVAEAIENKEVIVKEIEEERKMENTIEVRNSKEYINAYAEYIKTGETKELRTLLTENVEGSIAVPDLVYDEIKTAWDKEGIMALVSKANLKGNIKVNFEVSGTGAVIHTEGTGAVDEEELIEGIVTIVPAYRKKWISISDEVMSMRGESFLRYIYAEIGHKIVKKLADDLVALIVALPTTATTTSVSANKVALAPVNNTIATAFANLTDEAENPVIVMNKLTYAEFKKAQYDNNYGMDVFEGLKVYFNNTLPAYGTAGSGDVYAIVGDFGHGALANFPNGNEIEYTFDQLSRKKEDLVEVMGKEYVGLGLIADKSFTNIVKPSA